MLKCAKLKIFGRVQGVFFRDFTEEKAAEFVIVGWVKNMPDGTVEAIIQGEEDNINKMIACCHEGPSSAQVEEIKVEWMESSLCDSFEVRY